MLQLVLSWLLGRIYYIDYGQYNVGDSSLLKWGATILEPFGYLLGMDGYISCLHLGFPANEIVLAIIIMSYMATGSLLELEDIIQH